MSGEGDEFLVKLRQMQQFRRSHIKKHQEDSWPRFRLESREGDWSPMLKVWVSPAEADTHYGMRLTFLGREHWDKAVDWWSWLLETWPDARLIFLTRDLNEIEFSMEVTHHLRWVPLYGQCGGCCANRIRDLVGSMEDFNLMNPMRTLVMDSSDLADYNKTAEQLARVGIPLCREGWSREIGVISGAAKQLDLEYRSKFPLVTDPDDPFAPPTAEELAAHARASEDGRDPFAPFDPAIDVALPPVREDVTWDDVHPDVPLEQEDSGFLLPVPTEPAAAGKIEVHTLRYGDPDWMEHCAPTLDDWCSRHGYELKIHGPPVDMPDEKFGTIEMIRQFLAGDSDVMVFVDADVRIHPLAPPWQYREGFATRVEWYKRTLSKWHNWRRRNGHPLRRWAYRNTGVWSIDRKSAGTFLKVLGPVSAWTFGYREQHQFNIWMIAATSRGMRIVDMAPEWNVLAQLESRPGWFFHLNGRHKVKTLKRVWRKRYLPPPPRAVVKVEAALHPRAICYPWLASSAAWDELRYSLRSVEAHFLDKECPIYILGPVAPPWLRQEVGQRVRFIPIDYSRGNRKGMAEATRRGMQIAEKVLWMNDDIYLLKDCDWDTFEVALTEGCLDSKVDKLLKSKNGWQMGMANAVIDLKHHGVKSVMRFATHTPYLFEREKSLEIFRRFYLPYKGAWETLYHAWHGTAHKPYGKLRVEKLSNAKPQTLFLNHNNHTLTTALREAIVARFPSAGEWETAPPVANGTGLRLCVASHGEDVTWVDLTGIPANIYDATGSHPGLIPVPNEAREASQYLRHIIAKYPDFEDYEIFCQGDPFDHAPLLLDVLRLKEWEGLRFYPIGGTAGSSPEKWMNRIRKARAFIEGFDVHVPDDFLWVPGAQFVVSREALLARPLDWWERLLEKVLLERRYSPWIIERLWLLIFS